MGHDLTSQISTLCFQRFVKLKSRCVHNQEIQSLATNVFLGRLVISPKTILNTKRHVGKEQKRTLEKRTEAGPMGSEESTIMTSYVSGAASATNLRPSQMLSVTRESCNPACARCVSMKLRGTLGAWARRNLRGNIWRQRRNPKR